MILKLSVAAAVMSALLLAFLLVRSTDEVVPRGTKQLVTIWDVGTQITRSQAKTLVSTAAARHDVELYKSEVSATKGGSLRSLFIIHSKGGSGGGVVGTVYPDVSRFISTKFFPGRDLDEANVGGLYVTNSSREVTAAFVEDLVRHGIDADTVRFGPVEALTRSNRSVPVLSLISTAALSLLVGCVHNAVGRRGSDAIMLAHGASRGGRFAASLSEVLVHTGAAGAGALVVGVPVLWFYNGLAQFDRIAAVAAIALGSVAFAAATFTILTLIAESCVAPVTALTRARPLRRLAVFDMIVHSTALTVTLVSLTAATVLQEQVAANLRDSRDWAESTDVVSVNFSASDTEYDAIESQFARIGNKASESGQALITSHPTPPTRGYGPDDGNAMVVNPRYLGTHKVVNDDGRRVVASALDPNALTLLIPSNLIAQESRIVEVYRSWIDFQLEAGNTSAPAPADVPLEVVLMRPGQSRFNYSTIESTSTQKDPVIAVLPSATPLISDNWLVANASTGGVLFRDAQALRSEIGASGLGEYISSIEHVSDAAAIRLADQQRVLRAQFFGCVLAAGISALSCVVLAIALAERRRRIDFSLFVAGSHLGTGNAAMIGIVTVSGVLSWLAASSVAPALISGPMGWIAVAVNVSLVSVVTAAYRLRTFADTRDHA